MHKDNLQLACTMRGGNEAVLVYDIILWNSENEASQADDLIHILVTTPVSGGLRQAKKNKNKKALTSFARLLSCGSWKLLNSPSKPGPSPRSAFFFSSRVNWCSARQFACSWKLEKVKIRSRKRSVGCKAEIKRRRGALDMGHQGAV